jgi:acetyltransferase-like isoleucine patch superfamily enzyme
MLGVRYIYSRFLKKMRGIAINNSSIEKTSKVESGSTIVNTIMGRHSFCGYDCEISNSEIGSFCSIANGVVIGGGAHPIERISTSPAFYAGRDSIRAKFSERERVPPEKVVIGHDVWIGRNSLIKQGVTIGNGAVIGMGSVVTKDVLDYEIVAGNPAKRLRFRFDDVTIQKLVEIQWWEMNDSDISRYAELFYDPKLFVSEVLKK